MRNIVLGVLAILLAGPAAAQQAPARDAVPASASAFPPATTPEGREAIEQFLTSAKIVKTKGIGKGITGTVRATLSDGTFTHDAQIQTIDESKKEFSAGASSEFNFQDNWRFNVAAYRLDKLIGLNLVPPSVERRWRSTPAAMTWWIDDILMDEGARLKTKASSPHPAQWNEQMQLVRVFDQLIYNMDRNLGNLLIDKNWRIWAIDHTRAFRTHNTLKSADNITRCDRQVYERLKALDEPALDKELGRYLSSYQIKAILARRDAIVALLDQKGPTALFDRTVP